MFVIQAHNTEEPLKVSRNFAAKIIYVNNKKIQMHHLKAFQSVIKDSNISLNTGVELRSVSALFFRILVGQTFILLTSYLC